MRVEHGPFSAAIEAVQARVVKIYAAGVGTVKGYGSGVLVSADGRILTTLSAMLEDPSVRVVLGDGRRFPARLAARDERRQLAELRIEATELPYFEVADSAHLKTGDWLIAASNVFKVADGPEAVTVSVGVLSERAELAARSRAQDFSYAGEVLLTDALVASPGAAGGALADVDGRLVGVIGKMVTSTRTNTFVNYAIPVEEAAKFLRGEIEPAPAAGGKRADGSEPPGARVARSVALGIRLLDIGGRTRPAYVERVRPSSPAAAADLRPDDLILSIGGQAVATCEEVEAALARQRVGKPISIVLKRREEIRTVEIAAEEQK